MRPKGSELAGHEGQRAMAHSQTLFMCVCVGLQLGAAVTKNPGYLKLRRIRAAQNIAKTVLPTAPDF